MKAVNEKENGTDKDTEENTKKILKKDKTELKKRLVIIRGLPGSGKTTFSDLDSQHIRKG